MTDDTTDDTDVPAVTPAPGPDAFIVVANLIALITDPREMQGRLAELKAQIDAAEKAMRKLEHVREGHDRAVSRDRAELAAEREALTQRYSTVQAAEASLAEWKEKIVAFQYSQRGERDTRRYEPLPGGGSRDWGPNGMYRDDAPRPLDDPVYDQPRSVVSADETELEKVGPSSGTLTRSVPRPKRSMRKVQPDV